MRRKLILGAVALTAPLVLTSCTPGDIGTLGIRREADGSLTALIRLCHGSADEIVLRAVNSFPHDEDGTPQSSHWESVPDIDQPLAPPLVGDADVPITFDEDRLFPDVLYEFHTSSQEGWAGSGLFGAAELAEVEPGQILGPARSGEDGVFAVRSRDEFEEDADAFC